MKAIRFMVTVKVKDDYEADEILMSKVSDLVAKSVMAVALDGYQCDITFGNGGALSQAHAHHSSREKICEDCYSAAHDRVR